jgi:hypothetical protein
LLGTQKVVDYVAMLARFAMLFVTVTYPADYPSAQSSKQHLFMLRRRFERKFGERYIVWRLGMQRRGAPHYHFLVFGVPWLSVNWLRENWKDIIAYDGPERLEVDVQAVRSPKQAQSYVARYEAKEDDPDAADPTSEAEGGGVGGEDAVQLDPVPYLAAQETWDRPGRFWGEWRKGEKVLASSFQAEFLIGPWFDRLKDVCRYVWPGLNDRRGQGFTLYMPAAEFVCIVNACLVKG